MLRLDIFSDPVCPWCLIGKTWLDRALEARPDHPFAVAWHPFRLNPDMPAAGMDRREYLEMKFGSPEAAVRVYAQVDAAAREAGLTLDLGAITRTPDTLDAHRLIHWAGLEGRQTAVVSALFDAYFRRGRDIGDAETLVEIAAGAGMDPDLARRLLASDADRTDTAERDRRARAAGIKAVPTFIVAGRHVVAGAQRPEFWMQVIDELVAAEGPQPGTPPA